LGSLPAYVAQPKIAQSKVWTGVRGTGNVTPPFNAQASVNGRAFQFFGSDGNVIVNGNYLRS
jgi:hypothetical protein